MIRFFMEPGWVRKFMGLALVVMLAAKLLGCAGMLHLDLPPKVWWSPPDGAAAPKAQEPDPTQPANLPQRGY